jgi:hypothetical protein
MVQSKQVVATGGNRTIYETEGGIASLAHGGGIATLQAGTTVLPIGTEVTYTLSASGAIATGGDYVAIYLQGHTSGTQYAMMVGPNAIASTFSMPKAEKLDVLGGTTDTVDHEATYTWQGTSP